MANILGKIAWMPSGSESPLDYLLLPGAETPISDNLQTVYAASCEGSTWTKIGFSVCAETRLKELQIGCPFRLSLSAAVAVNAKGRTIERGAHTALAKYRKHGEWFDVSPLEAVEAILGACRKHHVQHWPIEHVYELERKALAQISQGARARDTQRLRKNLGWDV